MEWITTTPSSMQPPWRYGLHFEQAGVAPEPGCERGSGAAAGPTARSRNNGAVSTGPGGVVAYGR